MKAQTLGRVLLGSAMVGAGVLHLTTQRQEFQAQVPDWFPLDEDLTVIGSGVVEIALGGAFVALPKHRRTIGALLAAFFVAIFPGNIAQYVEGTDAFGLDTDRARFIRLFFQPVLVLVRCGRAACWVGGAGTTGRGAGDRRGRDGRVARSSRRRAAQRVGSQSTRPARTAYPTKAPTSSSVCATTNGITRPQRRNR